ncbi:peptidoglycan-binding protein [Actinoplanes sp. NPDC051851]|uniref:peptidoglycan-binding domain-containing protein n=1 Tax=Actinoplanes sp. NPDC051851 TaxID=3154753 RepID=UPI003430A4A7
MPTLQYLLRAHGHTVTVDGVFGAQTGDAVRAYQRTRGIPDNGVVCPETWEALLVTVKPGARGNAVAGVQQLAAVTANPDGVYGEVTEQAVRGFQASSGIPVDGVVGPRTWLALVESSAAAAPLQQAA